MRIMILKKLVGISVIALLALTPAFAETSRIKDLASIEGVRQNQLVGYGLVVGLNGTGDTLNNAPFTKQSLTAMLERLGVNTRGANLRTANVAAVMVTGVGVMVKVTSCAVDGWWLLSPAHCEVAVAVPALVLSV